MDFLPQLLSNEIFLTAAIAWMSAQCVKTLIHLLLTKTFVPERLVGSGGMPSCHSSTVCALATATSYTCGVDSPVFAITLILAIIVMYDAMGVRRDTGIQARVLNEMLEAFEALGKDISAEEKLKEFIGHTPLQVLVGAILGILTANILHTFFF